MAENKKDSFTFSDKIKNSKPAVNPFAKKGASKIGNNGKPKQTLFERSRRDAPFMIAAAAALLMLPFLYKYSGTVNDDVIVPPGSEDSIFDPERFGFSPSAEDPTGQIAQLAGRDPLSLIKGWGNPEEEQAAEPDYSYDRDGLDDSTYTPAPRPDTPNYRQTAPAATRAAFQRTPTKIKDLNGASLNLRGGGGVGSRFGGAQLKAAARQNSAGGPRRGSKPVSLTPLRAAGAPARSYFGQGAAAQARASRDALSKANASEALRDAMFAPVEHGRVGGLGDGVFASGGGPGKIDRNMDFKGLEPWWWDMMKQQEMEKWKWNYFLWRKGLVEPLIKALAEVLATFGKGLACCILTGEDDCDMGSMWGSDGTTGKAAYCKRDGKEISDPIELFKLKYPNSSADPKGYKLKDLCKEFGEYHDAKGGGGNLGPIGKRIHCLGGTYHGQSATDLKDRFDCEAVDSTHNFELQATGKAAKWKNYYHAVVVKNHVPFQLGDGTHYLCTSSQHIWNPQIRDGLKNIKETEQHNPENKAGEPALHATNKIHNKGNQKRTNHDGSQRHNYGDVDTHSVDLSHENDNDACVIYVAKGKNFRWETFKAETIVLLQSMLPNGHNQWADAEKAFSQLNLSFIEGYAMKQTLARKYENTKGGKRAYKDGSTHLTRGYKKVSEGMIDSDILPMPYVDFESLYVLRRNSGTVGTEGNDSYYDKERHYAETYKGADNSTRTTLANDGKENAIRTKCPFGKFRITAVPIESQEGKISAISANLNFNPNSHGKNGELITVTAHIDGVGDFVAELDPEAAPVYDATTGQSNTRWKLKEEDLQKVQRYMDQLTDSNLDHMQSIEVQWKAEYNGASSQDKAPYSDKKDKTCQPHQEEDENGCTWITPCDEEGRYLQPDKKYKVDAECGKCKEDKPAGEINGCEYIYKCQPDGTFATELTKVDENCGKCKEDEPAGEINGCEYVRKCQPDGTLAAELTKVDENCQPTNCTENRPAGKDADGCDQEYKCVDGRLDTTPTKVDENCRKATKVSFFKRVSKIPSGALDRINPEIRLGQQSGYATKWGNCSLDQQISAKGAFKRTISSKPVAVVDADVQHVMQMAKQIYDSGNAQNNSTIEYNPNKITIAELIDAMMILESSGATTIPMNTACMLGKSIGFNSIDPHQPHPYKATSSGRLGTEQMKNILLDNMFGTFAAYMGPDSSFYPRNMVGDLKIAKSDGRDPRFVGCAGGASVRNIGPAYHYGHYNWNHVTLGDQAPPKGEQDDRKPYENVLESGIWRGAPLKPIADAIGWERKTSWEELTREPIKSDSSMDRYNRSEYLDAYKSVFDATSSCNLDGKNISVENVKAYLNAICQPGALSAKPSNGGNFPCNKRFAEDKTARRIQVREGVITDNAE